MYIKKIFFIFALFLATLFLFFWYQFFYLSLNNSDTFNIDLRKINSASELSQILYQKKLISYPRLFTKLIIFQGLAKSLQSGIYEVTKGDSAQKLLQKISTGDVLIKSFRIKEGSTIEELKIALKNDQFIECANSDLLKFKSKYPTTEGLFLADTYFYKAGSSCDRMLTKAHHNLTSALNYSWESRAPNLPYNSAYELLIAASIVEKEAGVPRERQIIAGVIVNRINKKMRLQMDPTVMYGIKVFSNLTRANLRTDTLYNTYLHKGLPPTPIAMVSKESIVAVAKPIITNYYYYVAKGDGFLINSQLPTLNKSKL